MPEALALSPLFGFALAAAVYFGLSKFVYDKHLYEPAGERPPVWWTRAILILIPLPDHSEFMMYGNDVMDFTILGLCSM